MISQQYLKEILDYDAEYGTFYWKKDHINAIKKGHIAGTLNERTKYVVITINRKPYRASFLAYLYMTGSWPENDIIHLNGCRWVNSWDNLFYTQIPLKKRNTDIIKNNTSTVQGVCWRQQTQKWCGYITINGIKNHLGFYTDFEDAVCSRFAGEQSCKMEWATKSTARKYIIAHIQPELR